MRKTNRLLKNDEFTQVLNSGRKVKQGPCLVALKPNKLNHLRVGISVSKKVGGAVQRVRMRRQIRAIVGNLNLIDQPVDIVIIPKPDFAHASFEENSVTIKKAIDSLLNRRTK